MGSPSRNNFRLAVSLLAFALAARFSAAQSSPSPSPAPSILDRLNAMMAGGKSAWTPQQLATMERIREAALKDPYAFDELRHITENIGPRLSGSPQAQQAVDYVSAEMRALGAKAGATVRRCSRQASPVLSSSP